MMDEIITYKLYALLTNIDNIKALEAYEYTRICPEYALCFTEKDPPAHGLLINADNAYRLTDIDMRWLLSVKQTAVEAVEKECADKLDAARNEFLKRFEQELDKEREKQSQTTAKTSRKVKVQIGTYPKHGQR